MPGWATRPRAALFLALVGATATLWFAREAPVPDRPAPTAPSQAERLADLAMEPDGETRKRRFVGLVLPLILAENDAILAERRAVAAYLAAIAGGRAPEPAEHRRLARLAFAYGASSPEDLLGRIDIVPPSLALAQAAVESGWGTSRFAQQGNALFGQRAWRAGAGLVPEARAGDADFEVRAFATLDGSVRAYMRNLNSHAAYAPFRAARAGLRAAGRSVGGDALAWTLIAYSEQGDDYVALVRAVMRDNRFDVHDGARALIALREAGEDPAPRRGVLERSG